MMVVAVYGREQDGDEEDLFLLGDREVHGERTSRDESAG